MEEKLYRCCECYEKFPVKKLSHCSDCGSILCEDCKDYCVRCGAILCDCCLSGFSLCEGCEEDRANEEEEDYE
ncbi:hypothetical protein UT300003_32700 [Clostridium sardiniense]